MKEDFKGVYCVSVTAFKDDESIDEERTKAHLDRVIDAGVHGIIIGINYYVTPFRLKDCLH